MRLKKFLAVTVAVLGCSTNVFAGELSTEKRMEDLNYLYDTLKGNHPNLFYNHSEEEFEAKKQEIEAHIADGSDFEFVLDMQSLVALAGDSHTTASLNIYEGVKIFPINLARYDGKWTVVAVPNENADMLGKRIIAIEGIPVDEVYKKFSTLCSADNDESLKKQFEQIFYVDEILDYLGIKRQGEPLMLELADDTGIKFELALEPIPVEDAMNKKINLASIPQRRLSSPPTDYDGNKNYFGKELNNSAYYIQYNRCKEDESFTIEEFGKQVNDDLRSGKYTQIIMDLRNNGGGGDGVIQPILRIIKEYADENNSTIYGLIGKRTFSSAIINSMMIKEMGGYLVGTPTSGSVDHFGSVNSFRLPNSGLRVGYSTKLILMDEYLECGQGFGIETLQPDLTVEESLEDYINGKDTVMEVILKNPKIKSGEKYDPIYMTRGAFVHNLYKIAQKYDRGDFSEAMDFYDVFPFAKNYDAVAWASENGIAVGIGEGRFAPAIPITVQNAAVIMDRFIAYMGYEIEEEHVLLIDRNISNYALQSVNNMASIGVIAVKEGSVGPEKTINAVDGEAMVSRLDTFIAERLS
ncbi:hypothetical protein IMSAG049_00138 [Clostridiales bacterium]|nr:hypothetical protein IMSAG049_00138 [Clostridiales bacterium]